MDDAIKRALEVAQRANCCPDGCEVIGCTGRVYRARTAAAIAAFLEALPSLSALPVTDGFERVGISVRRSRALAAAVRRAAKEGSDAG